MIYVLTQDAESSFVLAVRGKTTARKNLTQYMLNEIKQYISKFGKDAKRLLTPDSVIYMVFRDYQIYSVKENAIVPYADGDDVTLLIDGSMLDVDSDELPKGTKVIKIDALDEWIDLPVLREFLHKEGCGE